MEKDMPALKEIDYENDYAILLKFSKHSDIQMTILKRVVRFAEIHDLSRTHALRAILKVGLEKMLKDGSL